MIEKPLSQIHPKRIKKDQVDQMLGRDQRGEVWMEQNQREDRQSQCRVRAKATIEKLVTENIAMQGGKSWIEGVREMTFRRVNGMGRGYRKRNGGKGMGTMS